MLDPPSPEELASCPFCAGHEEMTPPQTLVLPETGDWQVRVVPNLYPALERQEVVVHSRRHIRSIAEASDEELELVAEAWRRRSAAEPGYVFPLINEGRGAGASLAHSHSQLIWLQEPTRELPRPRGVLVLERDDIVVSCPWAARVPYETVIAPAEAEADALSSPLLGSALQTVAALVRRLQELEGPVPLNVWLERAGADWRLVLFPRLSILAGLELGAGIFVNTLAPEEAAARLQGA
ncbi:MAG: UDPglucose--hexose-phosphate uridylyltransferase [Gaiellaceae bacterium]|nr:UDPglucose--hexose-phosphate uridylyltransferase [Gaiellaceae bacterium]